MAGYHLFIPFKHLRRFLFILCLLDINYGKLKSEALRKTTHTADTPVWNKVQNND